MSQPDAAEMWNRRYGADEYVYGHEPNDLVAAAFADGGYVGAVSSNGQAAVPMDVLVLADGEGRNGVWLAGQGHRVTTVDISDAGVAKARALAADKGVEMDIRQGDLMTFDLGEDRWDVIVSIFAHTPPPVRTRVHNSIAAALKPGGRLVLEAYTPAQAPRDTGGPGVAKMTMTLAELRHDLTGMVIDRGEEFDRDVQEGPGHTGLGSVVQVEAHRPA